mmetsp:Transcript_26003/g.61330  ORF Transcript_26003/g.61330 Transcript_26003/m.61330 type:complete len:463 (-) Transcript_26003:51-1439(-)
MTSFTAQLRSIDFYRKVSRDFTVGTLSGSAVSIITAFVIVFLVGMELSAYLTVTTSTRVVIDRTSDELLKINFNLTFPHLECQFASVDVSDILGRHKVNLTKTVKKWKIDGEQRIVSRVASEPAPDPVYGHVDHSPDEQISLQLNIDNWNQAMKDSKMVVVNFYAPWCPWSRQLQPVWEHTAGLLKHKYDGSVVTMAKVDCTAPNAHAVCHNNHVNAFPSIRIYRGGSDQKVTGHGHEHNAYYGDRTPEALSAHIEKLLEADKLNVVKQLPAPVADRDGEMAAGEGCLVSGYVRVARVPGNLHISSHHAGFSFNFATMNVSHIVHHFSFGEDLSEADTARLPEEARTKMGLLDRRTFLSKADNTTHEHYLKVVLNTFQFLRGEELNTYEFTANSNKITGPDMPMARFSYDLSPMQVVLTEQRMGFSHFLTQLCAIVGGVFTVAGIIDSMIFHGLNALQKKDL